MKGDKILSFVIYLLGTAAFFFVDMIVTRQYSHDIVAYWAEFKSILSIGVIFCLLGLDQVLVRYPDGSVLVFRRAIWQILSIATLLSVVLWVFDLFPDFDLAFFSLSAVSFAMLLMQYFRMAGRLSLSQLVQHSWKIILLLLIFLHAFFFVLAVKFPSVLFLVFLLVFLGSFFLVVFYSFGQRHFGSAEFSRGLISGVGGRYFLTSVLLVLSIYLEQLIVSGFYGEVLSAQYFAISVYFLFPVSIMNGFLAFNAGPWIRSNLKLFSIIISDNFHKVILISLVYVVACAAAGLLFWNFIIGSKFDLDWMLVAVFLISSFFKTIYIVPAGFFSVGGTIDMHDWLISRFILSLFLAISVFVVGYYIFSVSYIIVAVAAMLNLLLRCFFAYRAMFLWGNFREQ